MDTLPMPDAWWDDNVNEEGQDSTHPPSLAGEVPPTQPDTCPETDMEEEDGYMAGETTKVLEGDKEEKMLGGEGEEGGTEISPTPVSQHFPMVSRAEQQAFKEAKGRVAKMDEANQVPDSNKNKVAEKRRPSQSTNPAQKKAKQSKKAQEEMAKPVETEEPVEVLEVDDDENHVPRANLEKKFDHVADPDEPCSDVAEPASPAPKTSRRSKGKAKPKTKASPKASTKPPSPKLKRRTAAKSRANAKVKVQKKVEAGDKAGDKGSGGRNEEEEGGKKTFAGRYCPKGEETKLRWQCLKDVFIGSILPHLSCQQSTMEAWFLRFSTSIRQYV